MRTFLKSALYSPRPLSAQVLLLYLMTIAPEAQAVSQDIVGIRLGMTPDQVVAAIKGYKPSLNIQQVTASLPDGSKYLRQITASKAPRSPIKELSVVFALPPAKPKAHTVRRFLRFNLESAPPLRKVLHALKAKYGVSSSDDTRGRPRGGLRWRHIHWLLSSGQNCKALTHTSPRASLSLGFGSASAYKRVLGWRRSSCATEFGVRMEHIKDPRFPDSPVRGIGTQLSNVKYAVQNYLAFEQHFIRKTPRNPSPLRF